MFLVELCFEDDQIVEKSEISLEKLLAENDLKTEKNPSKIEKKTFEN